MFTLARFGEVALSGAGRLYVPTSQATPGAAANAVAAQNAAAASCSTTATTQNSPVGLPAGRAVGVQHAAHRRHAVDAQRRRRLPLLGLPRAADRAGRRSRTRTRGRQHLTTVGGNLRIASLNVLNFFNGDGAGGGFPTSRGANTPFELQRQRAKEVNALATMNADIVGLMEMENDAAPNSAVAELVAGLNDKLGAGRTRTSTPVCSAPTRSRSR